MVHVAAAVIARGHGHDSADSLVAELVKRGIVAQSLGRGNGEGVLGEEASWVDEGEGF